MWLGEINWFRRGSVQYFRGTGIIVWSSGVFVGDGSSRAGCI